MTRTVYILALVSALSSAGSTILIRQGLRGSTPFTGFWINLVVGTIGLWAAVLLTGGPGRVSAAGIAFFALAELPAILAAALFEFTVLFRRAATTGLPITSLYAGAGWVLAVSIPGLFIAGAPLVSFEYLRNGAHLGNALLPVITLSGVLMGLVLAGSIPVERAFATPGLGFAMFIAVSERDIFVMQNLVFLYAAVFVLLNIVKATLQAATFVPLANFSLKTFAERSFGLFQERPVKVAWRFSPRAAADARAYEFHPHQIVSDEPDGSVLIEFTAGGLREMCWHLFTWAGEVEIVRPQRLAAMMREELALNERASERKPDRLLQGAPA